MQNNNEIQNEDVFTLKRELAAIMVQIRLIEEKRDKLVGNEKKRRPPKPIGRNAELWPEQAMMVLGVSRRKLAAMLRTGQLTDLHPFSIGTVFGGYMEPRLQTQWKKKHDYWKLQWTDYNAWKKKGAEKRAENAMMLRTDTKNT